MRGSDTGTAFSRSVVVGLLAVLLLLLPAAGSAAQDQGRQQRLERKIRVMEGVLEEVLILSDHVSVSPGGGAVHGLALDDFGAFFVLDASLAGGSLSRVTIASSDRVLVVGDPETTGGDADGRRVVSLEELLEENKAERAEHLDAIRGELTDALIDYGATLGELGDDQWIAVAVFFDRDRFNRSETSSELVLRVRLSTLRRYVAGAITREAARNAVQVEQR